MASESNLELFVASLSRFLLYFFLVVERVTSAGLFRVLHIEEEQVVLFNNFQILWDDSLSHFI